MKHVIILGNGFSSLPIEIRDKLPKSAQLVVVDPFSYKELESDLQSYKSIAQIEEVLKTIQKMKALESEGKLNLIKSEVGDKDDNSLLRNADMVINVCGPTQDTVQSQLTMLNQSGLLVTWFGTFQSDGEELPELQ